MEEELGSPPPAGDFVELGELRQRSGKNITAFGLTGEFDTDTVRSNTFEVEWPRGSGRIVNSPEVDRAAWLTAARMGSLYLKVQIQCERWLLVPAAGTASHRAVWTQHASARVGAK